MRRNFEFFNKQGFVRTGLQVIYTEIHVHVQKHNQYIIIVNVFNIMVLIILNTSLLSFFTISFLQMTKALSKIATTDLPRNYSNLRRSLATIVTYADEDSRVKVGVITVQMSWEYRHNCKIRQIKFKHFLSRLFVRNLIISCICSQAHFHLKFENL